MSDTRNNENTAEGSAMLTKSVAGRTWHFSHSIGHFVGPQGFTYPSPIAATASGTIYIADIGMAEGYPAKIFKYRIEDEFLGEMGQGDLVWPQGLALARDGSVWCADAFNHRIYGYDTEGAPIGNWGEFGSGDGQFNRPAGIAFDADDNVFVVDSLNHRVQKFTKDGEFLGTWGSQGSAIGELDQPWGLTIDPQGAVYVADWGNDRVQKFTPDGEPLVRFGSQYEGVDDGGALNHPADVAIDSEGDVYVADWGNRRVQVYYPDGDIVCGLYGDAHGFSKAAQKVMDVNADYMRAFKRVNPVELINFGIFDRPRGIAIDGQDRIAIGDGGRGRVQIYNKDLDYPLPQFNA